DEDLLHMMDECKELDNGGSNKLRIFLISKTDLDDSELTLESVEGDAEVQYFVAVNGMGYESRGNSFDVENHLGNNLDELLGLGAQRETSRMAPSFGTGGTANPEVTVTSQNQSSHVAMPRSSHSLEATISREEPEWHSSQAHQKMDAVSRVHEKTAVPESQSNYGSQPLSHAPHADNLVSNYFVNMGLDEATAVAVAVGHSYG
ncbi:hypothetical protein ABTG41_04005, partial [Acinetobacter baumannii]